MLKVFVDGLLFDIPHSLNLGVRTVFDCGSVFAFVGPILFVLQSFLLQSGWLRGCLSSLRSSSVVNLSFSSDGNCGTKHKRKKEVNKILNIHLKPLNPKV